MSDSNFAATPYPTYNLGGDDDSVQQAVLTSHTGASVERNQDAGFASVRAQFVHRDVVGGAKDGIAESLRVQLAVKDAEIRGLERHSEIKAELAAMRAEGLSRELNALRADSGNEKLASVLARIATKVGA